MRECKECGRSGILKGYTRCEACYSRQRRLRKKYSVDFIKNKNKKFIVWFNKNFKNITDEKTDEYEKLKVRSHTNLYKKELFSILGSKCLICGKNDDIILHHITYLKKFKTKDLKILSKNIILLCRYCHNLLHHIQHTFVEDRIQKLKEEYLNG